MNILVGLKDFVGQVLPGPEEAAPGGAGGAAGQLLRRAKEYEVRRMEVGQNCPGHLGLARLAVPGGTVFVFAADPRISPQ